MGLEVYVQISAPKRHTQILRLERNVHAQVGVEVNGNVCAPQRHTQMSDKTQNKSLRAIPPRERGPPFPKRPTLAPGISPLCPYPPPPVASIEGGP